MATQHQTFGSLNGSKPEPARERRRQVADDLYDALVIGGYSFWDHIYPLFLSRDLTRNDIRELVRRGLATTKGNYRVLLELFGMPKQDYKRFLNFLAAHECRADFREFRNGASTPSSVRPRLVLPARSEPDTEPEIEQAHPAAKAEEPAC